MYKLGYKLLKRAGFWLDFNNFADLHEYVRPLLYSGIGAGAGAGLGALMGRRDRWLKMLLGGMLGAGIGAGGGLYHNTYRSQLAKAKDDALALTLVDMLTGMQQELLELLRLVRLQMDRELRREKLRPRFVKQHPVDQAPKEIQQANDFYNAQQLAQGRRGNSDERNKSIVFRDPGSFLNMLEDARLLPTKSFILTLSSGDIDADPYQAQYDLVRDLNNSMRNRGLGYLLRYK